MFLQAILVFNDLSIQLVDQENDGNKSGAENAIPARMTTGTVLSAMLTCQLEDEAMPAMVVARIHRQL